MHADSRRYLRRIALGFWTYDDPFLTKLFLKAMISYDLDVWKASGLFAEYIIVGKNEGRSHFLYGI